MTKIAIEPGSVNIVLTGFDMLLSFKHFLHIPRDRISRAYLYDGKINTPFWKMPGTYIPWLISAGTFYSRGRKEFWNTRHGRKGIVLELNNAGYSRIVLSLDKPEAILKLLGFRTT